MVITDRYDHLIDDKNRLAIPSQVRNVMNPETDGTAFYLVPEGRYLQLIPEKLFERLSNLTPTGLMPAPEVAKVRRYLFSNSARVEPDKQGRVMIPERFMRDSKNPDPIMPGMLSKEVTLVGANDRIELWNRADYIAHMRELMADRLSFQTTMQQLFGNPPPVPSGPGGMSPGTSGN
jgi:MraZ protein